MGQPLPGASALVGQVMAGLHLEQILGSGATSVVYLGRQQAPGAPAMAVKVLMLPAQLSLSDVQQIKERFHHEMGRLQLLRHPNIVPLYAFGEDPGTGLIYTVSPYISGGTLAARRARGRLPLPEAAHIAAQVASALDHAHQHEIVHRDLQPANILLDEQLRVPVSDFGIAPIFDPIQTVLTAAGTVIGSAAYMAPEQARGEEVTPAADIYSLGAVLYHMVTGQAPFSAPSFAQLEPLHLQAPPPSPRMLCPELPEPAALAILQALAQDPAQRFARAGALASAFSAAIQASPGNPMPRVPPPSYQSSLAPGGYGGPPPAVGAWSTSSNVPTLPAAGAVPTRTVAPTPERAAGTQSAHVGAVITVVSLLLVVALAALFMLRPGALAFLSPPIGSPATPTTPAATPVPTFQLNRVYSYNVLIGHTKPNRFTNDDVYVTLVSLAFDAGSGTSQLTVMFQNDDSAKSADLAIANTESGLPPQNVYMIDNNGVRYPALVATPNEVVVRPGQTVSLTVSLSLIQPTASYLAIYFNTKFNALDTQCTQVFPTGQTAICPGT